MEKDNFNSNEKNIMLTKKQKISLTTGIFLLIICIVGASYAYFSVRSTSASNSITTTFGKEGTISLTNPTPNLHIRLSNNDMNVSNEDKSYFATDDENKNYDEQRIERTIAKLELMDETNTNYLCSFKINLDLSGTLKDELTEGDAILHFSGDYTDDIDLSNYTTPIDASVFLNNSNSIREIKAVLEIKNKVGNQNNLAGKSFDLNISNTDLNCDKDLIAARLSYSSSYTNCKNIQCSLDEVASMIK